MITAAGSGEPEGDAADRGVFEDFPAFLRFDPPELQDGSMVIRAVPADVRERRRLAHGSPLAYLYEVVSEWEPEQDVVFTAGHFDETNLVWSFSGEVTGIFGITQPTSPPPS
ncbi:hypothetical protein [Thermomonospora echinospora]|uniref:hypothetical protein n=1 Tax=Thermomonospora echinospora TaxID=1992 RepID=UPI0011B0E834|nr:hypothetical protein [Thermomonospora echinospora]